jgi:hypothetical protein
MQPTAQAVGSSGKGTSPSGAKDEFSHTLFRGWPSEIDFFRSPLAPEFRELEFVTNSVTALDTAPQRLKPFAEKLDFVLAFGWRSGLPLR